jgi:HSP20 family molecular chaperone IbpA
VIWQLSSESKQASYSAVHAYGWNVAAACIEPLHNVSVTANEIILTIDLPFVSAKSIRLRYLTVDEIEIYAETSKKISFKELGVKHRHGEFTCYHARIRVPAPIKRKLTSKLKRGVLEVHLKRLG